MKKIILLVLSIALCQFWSCSDSLSSNLSGDKKQLPHNLTAAQKKLAQSFSKFGIKLFKNISEVNLTDNVFISPLSVAYALGMAYNGAANETRQAIGNVLELDSISFEEINQNYKNLIDFLTTVDSSVTISIANSIWYRSGFEIKQDFINLNKEFFDAETAGLNFSTPEAVDIINNWVGKTTNQKITKIVESPIDPSTLMFLINAVYFNGLWQTSFDKENTETGPFNISDNVITECQMMYAESDFEYFENDDFQAINIYYGDQNFCLTIFLPTKGNSIASLLSLIIYENYQNWLTKFEPRKVLLSVPKFKYTYKSCLDNILKQMGMKTAFLPNQADFSNILESNDLYVQNVLHKSYVQLDESGTEAAAVTSISIGITSVSPEPVPVIFKADHPFIFFIREINSEAIIFSGILNNPEWEN